MEMLESIEMKIPCKAQACKFGIYYGNVEIAGAGEDGSRGRSATNCCLSLLLMQIGLL